MTFNWMGAGAPCPIVEFVDVRTAQFGAETYLTLTDRLAPAMVAVGVDLLGQFRVAGQPDRLLLLRGYGSVLVRRKALTAFHAGRDWAAERHAATDLVRKEEVLLSRSITPQDGFRRVLPGETLVALISEVRFAEQIGDYHLWLRLLLRKAGMDPVAAFATLEAVNDVPAVPVNRNRSQHVALVRTRGRVPELPAELRGMLRYAPEILQLEPAGVPVW